MQEELIVKAAEAERALAGVQSGKGTSDDKSLAQLLADAKARRVDSLLLLPHKRQIVLWAPASPAKRVTLRGSTAGTGRVHACIP